MQTTRVTQHPHNATTGKDYNGGNADKLAEVMAEKGYRGKFATFNQWRNVGRCVKKGESAAAKLCYIAEVPDRTDKKPDTGKKKKARMRSFSVFAVEQTEEL